jgi:sterol 14-demethylase
LLKQTKHLTRRAITQKDAPPHYGILAGVLCCRYKLAQQGPLELVRAGHKATGSDIFRIQVLHKHITFCIGPHASEFFFSKPDAVLSQKEVYSFTVPVFGKDIVYDAPRKKMGQQLRFVGAGLNSDAMESHCAKVVAETQDFFSGWGSEGVLEDMHHSFAQLTILTACRALLGKEIRANCSGEMADLYQDLSDGMNHLSFFWPTAPTRAHKKRDIARAKIVDIFGKVIDARRAAAKDATKAPEAKETDFLQVLLDSKYTPSGESPSKAEICGLLLAALFAGQHTSSFTSTWLGYLILTSKDKTLLPRIMAEQKRVLTKTNGVITRKALGEMTLLHNCMKETLRMYPPLIMLMRQVIKPVTYKCKDKKTGKPVSYTVPKGDVIIACPPVSHRLADVFEKPDEFIPERFARTRIDAATGKEVKQTPADETHKYSYVAFGGGRHRCLGEHYGFLQVKSIWSVLFRNFDFEISGTPKPDFSHIVVGPTPCKISYKRKANPMTFSSSSSAEAKGAQ